MAPASRRIRRLARRGLGVGRKVRDRASAVRLTRQRQGLLGSDAGVRQVSFGGEALWGRVVDGFTAAGAAADNLGLVADALERAEISYFVVPGVSRTAWALGVREADREAFLKSMRELYAGTVVFAARPRPGGVSDFSLFADEAWPKSLSSAPVMRFGVVRLGPAGQLLGGPQLGCDVEFWQDGAEVLAGPQAQAELARVSPQASADVLADSLVAPRRNRIADVVPTAEQTPAKVTVGGRDHPTFAPFAVTTVEDVTFPIDVVYTWVDGQDPALRAKRQKYRGDGDAGIAAREVGESRYTSHDELKYSLRSLQMYAGFVRHVYIVTDGQTPEWLDADAPGITVVDHKDIFPEGVLPVFNSHAIETRLHHIPGLSDHYLYFNDDVFVGRSVTPQHFFYANGIARLPFSTYQIGVGDPHPQASAPNSAGRNVRRLLEETYGVSITHKFLHTPHPQRRDVLNDLERDYPEAIERTMRSRFRSIEDVAPAASFHHHLALLTGRAVPAKFTYRYVDVGKPHLEERVESLKARRGYDFFCLNDVDTAPERREYVRSYVHDFLEWYFPYPSSFERA
ncbi:stealth family protein [Streptomyces albogriseolus]|uniref:stealth family protein n=1 Tax=Streptomyces albogriseolus TaxID=1887 RepID=UPI003460DB28